MINLFVVIIRDYSSSMSRTTDGNKDSSIYAFFLLLFSKQAKRFAVYKNAQSLKYIVFEYILIITKGYVRSGGNNDRRSKRSKRLELQRSAFA